MRRAAPAAMLATVLAGPAAAQHRAYVAPYIEAQQVLDVPLAGGRDVLTYSALIAGVEAGASGGRIEGTISYRYERRFPWGGGYGIVPNDLHSGLARGSVSLVPNLLTLEAGGIATRTRTDIRGGGVDFLGGRGNSTQVYGGYVGPTLATRIGGLDVAASYRLGYTKADGGGVGDLGTTQFALNRYDSSVSHTAFASVGMRPGDLPFDWTVSGSFQREAARPLSQRFDNGFVRAQVTVPVSPTLALTGAVGYEDIRSSQRAVLRDASGAPVLDDNARYVANRNARRVIAYDFSGLLYDAGVIWRPDRRTELTATVGRRYGQLAVTGTFSHRINSASGVSVVVYNGIDSFGRSLGANLAALPTQFAVPRIGFTNRVDGCVFGQASGGCFNDAFQSLNTANYRSRGVNALYSASRGPVSVGVGIGYDERRFLGPVLVTSGVAFERVTDRSVTGQANVAFALDTRSSLNNQVFVGWYDSGLPGATAVLTGGAATNYVRRFTDRLSGNASIAVYASDQQDRDTDLSAQFLLGARYQF